MITLLWVVLAIAIFWILPGLICLAVVRGDPEPEYGPLGFLPGIGIVLAFVAMLDIMDRSKRSNGRCRWGHDFSLRKDTESDKWKNGREPIRISIGGYEDYKCKKCFQNRTVKWSAF